jgi:hypothetical protein
MHARTRVECAASLQTLAVASLIALLGGCRQVLGIDPLELADASDDSSLSPEGGGADAAGDTGASVDTGAGDASGVDAGPADTSPADDGTAPGDDSSAADSGGFTIGPFDASAYAACTSQGVSCQDCCTTTYASANAELVVRMNDNGCLCDNCRDECSATWCASPPETDAGTLSLCQACVMLEVVNPMTTCVQALTACQNSPTCRDVVQCVYACSP